jgi:pyrimidine-nucleoside phosphorylase
MIEAQGGDTAAFENRARLPTARIRSTIAAQADGYLARLDALTVAHASTLLGAGRERKGEAIDLAVGIVLQAKVGDRVSRGQPLAVLHANDAARLQRAEGVLREAIQLSVTPVQPQPLILQRLGTPAARALA